MSPLWLLLRVHLLQGWRRILHIRNQSRLLTAIILLFISGYALLAFELFYYALKFVGRFPGLGTVLVERLMFLLFAFLFAMLLMSNLVIGYTNLFRNRETEALLSLPVSTDTIFRWKFIESALVASWAFVFLIAPLLAAFGLTRGVAWHFYPLTIGLIALFIVLPGIFGVWGAIQLARYLDRRAFQLAVALGLGLLVALAVSYWKVEPLAEEAQDMRVLPMLDQLLVKTRFAMFPFLPSYWLSSGVLQWTEGALTAAGFFMLVLLSHAAFFGSLAFTRFGRSFYESASVVQSRASVWGQWEWFHKRRRVAGFKYPVGAMERLFRLFVWLKPDERALLVKDARMFWRDTTQWGQTAMLFGLLAVYIINLRHFTAQLTNLFWVNLVAYMNLFACSLNLATLTTRFVYPQFSLEGRRLWIVGLSPMGLARVVKIKFWQGSCAALLVTLGLITLSCTLLEMPWRRVAYFGAVVGVMTLTLNGLAVGIGVLYPNFRENNPSKIVSGFGGTLCLVLSFVYTLGSVLLLAIGAGGLRNVATEIWSVLCVGLFALLSLALGWLPMKLSLHRLKTFEI